MQQCSIARRKGDAVSNIDVAIPLIGGLVVVFWPRALMRQSEDSAVNEANARKMRLGGLALISIAGLYALLTLAQP